MQPPVYIIFSVGELKSVAPLSWLRSYSVCKNLISKGLKLGDSLFLIGEFPPQEYLLLYTVKLLTFT